MPVSNSPVFAPNWVKCAACGWALLPFPALLLAVAVEPNRWLLLVPAPIAAQVFFTGLDCLMFGRPRRTFFSLAANLVSGRFRATHDSRSRPRSQRAG